MPGRRRTGSWVAGVLGLAVAVGLVAGWLGNGRRGPSGRTPLASYDAATPLATLAPALRDSDARALGALLSRLTPADGAPPPAVVGEAEAKAWLGTLAALRTGYPRLGGDMRAKAVSAATKILDRFAVDPAPACWSLVLSPVLDILVSGMADPDLSVRATALAEVGRLWVWIPGRTPERTEENALALWKGAMHAPVLRCLGDRSPTVRTAAVACLGTLPIDSAAAPAVAYLEDTSAGAGPVRHQVLISFARRRTILTEDAVLKRLYDPEPGIADLAELVLKTRGLSHEQISLGRMIFHPKPELRASVIPLLRDRTDIDPVVWLLQLSRDGEPAVRASAVEALAGRLSPEVRRRLAEMAAKDQSPAVRQAASKIVPLNPGKTAALPPLPGSTSLSPKAN